MARAKAKIGRSSPIYVTYRFLPTEKDPIIDKMRTAVGKTKWSRVAELSGVSPATLHNWFVGGTRRPQFATIAAVAAACNCDVVLMKRSVGEKVVQLRAAKRVVR